MTISQVVTNPHYCEELEQLLPALSEYGISLLFGVTVVRDQNFRQVWL